MPTLIPVPISYASYSSLSLSLSLKSSSGVFFDRFLFPDVFAVFAPAPAAPADAELREALAPALAVTFAAGRFGGLLLADGILLLVLDSEEELAFEGLAAALDRGLAAGVVVE